VSPPIASLACAVGSRLHRSPTNSGYGNRTTEIAHRNHKTGPPLPCGAPAQGAWRTPLEACSAGCRQTCLVIAPTGPGLPGRLGHTWELALERAFAECDARQAELAVERTGPTGEVAPVADPRGAGVARHATDLTICVALVFDRRVGVVDDPAEARHLIGVLRG